MKNYLGDDERGITITRNEYILSKKLKEIEYYANGFFYPVSLLAFDKNGIPSAEKMFALVENFIDCGSYNYPFIDDGEKEFVRSFLFLAMTVCAFFEKNIDAATDLQHISLCNLAGVLALAKNDGFCSYLAQKHGLDMKREHSADSFKELHSKATMSDLEWYEYDWTESLYGSWLGADKHNNFFNLMYIICSVIQDKKYTPDYDGIYPIPQKPSESGPRAVDCLTDPGLREYESVYEPDIFEENEHIAHITSHAYLIELFSHYADVFPYPGGKKYRCTFLEEYKIFRQNYLVYGYKGNLEYWVKTCLTQTLSHATDLSFLGDATSFDKLYEKLFFCVREIQSLYEEKLDSVLAEISADSAEGK